MGASKLDHYPDDYIKMSAIAKALGHPARLSILILLLNNRNLICDDLHSYIPLSQATISQHLRELKNAGLIKECIIANAIFYRVECKNLLELEKYLQLNFKSKMKRNNSELANK